MSLRHSYTLIAPFYDRALAAATRSARAASLAHLAEQPCRRVLLAGVGTGLDLPHLPPQHDYVGIDLTRAMLVRSHRHAGRLRYAALQGDVEDLPFADHSFECAVLHLILAVVPNPRRCLDEVLRVVRPGGEILLFDKFLRPGQAAPLRRLVNPLSRRLATRLDVVLEDLLIDREVDKIYDEAALAGGWFRRVRLLRLGSVSAAGALQAAQSGE
ncbi:MAG: class I SAM-dependent methyltransferase [Rhodocyclaceae bacterium]|nr:class I SAM-dependent methyltransferase [Rhodocyclaceae bacterium]